MKSNINLFKQIRDNHKLTQTAFANKLNVSRSSIAKIESGELEISKKIIQKLYNNFPNDIEIISQIYKDSTIQNSDLIKIEILDLKEKEQIYNSIKSLWESIDNLYYSIMFLIDLKEDIISKSQYGFISNVNNRYQDEKNIFLNNQFPSFEREYKEPYTIKNIKDLSLDELILYFEELSKNNELFSNIFYKNFSNIRFDLTFKK
ncbi:helix-turn-helix domain-containing protein [Empedobacter falsenii]